MTDASGTTPTKPPVVELQDPVVARREEIQRTTLARLGRRKLTSRAAAVVCIAALIAVMVPLVAVIGYTIKRGVRAWSVGFFTNLPTPAGIPGGGIHNAIIGTLIIDAVAAVMAVPVGVGTAIWLSRSDGRVAGLLRFGADVLAGIPSIVIGIFAYTLLVVTVGHFSALSASFALAVLMLPIIVRASEIALRSVPKELLDAGHALALPESSVMFRVALPVALPGVVTGVLLGVARAAGETAPLLFTAIGSQYWSISLTKPIAAMPLVIFLNGIQAYKDLQQIAWGTALALIVIVLVLNITARLWTARIRRTMR